MPTATIGASVFGDIQSTNNNLTTMRNGSSLSLYTTNGDSCRIGLGKVGTPYFGWQTFLKFDLSSIPSGSTITNVVMNYDVTAKDIAVSGSTFIAAIPDIGTLTTADWLNVASLDAVNSDTNNIIFNMPAFNVTTVGTGKTQAQNSTRGNTVVAANAGGSLSMVFWYNRLRSGSTPTALEAIDYANFTLTFDYVVPYEEYDETANSQTVVDVDTYGTAVHKIAENVTNASRTQVLAQTYGTISHIIRENPSTSRVNVLAQTYGTAVLNTTQHLPVNTLTVQTYGTDYEAMKEHTNRVDVLAQTYGTIGLSVADNAGSVQILSQTYGSVSHLINEHTNIVTVLVNVSGFSGITETGNPIVLLTQTYGTDRADYKELLYPNVVLVSTTGIGNHTASELAGLSTIIAQTYGNVAHQMVENAVIQTVLAQVYGIDSALFLESSGPVVVDVETYGVAGMFSLEHSGPIVVDISTLGTDISNVLEYLNNVTVVVETLGFTIETEGDGFVTVLVQTFGSDGFDLTFPVRYRVANLHTQNPYAVSLRVRR